MGFLIESAYAMFITLQWMAGLGLCFALLSRFMPCNPGMRWWERKDEAFVDLVYWLLLPPVLGLLRQMVIVTSSLLIFAHNGPAWMADYFNRGYGPLSQLPMWAQVALVLVVQDIYMYWVHRLFHTNGAWSFHALHHAPERLDWVSTRRFHPINSVFSFYMADLLVLLMGVSPEAIIWLVPFNIIYSSLVHANLNWTFGPFRYVLSSPVFHRWHHTGVKEGGMRNFAPTFPILDILFGTYYMPKDRLPQKYGIGDPRYPKGFWGQMLYPFRRRG